MTLWGNSYFSWLFRTCSGRDEIENGDFLEISPRFSEKVGEFLRESPAVEASISMKGTRMCFRMGKCSVFLSIVGRSGSVCCKTGLE